MGYLDDYDKRVLKECRKNAIYKNAVMVNLANGRLRPSNTGQGYTVETLFTKSDIDKTLRNLNINKDSAIMEELFEKVTDRPQFAFKKQEEQPAPPETDDVEDMEETHYRISNTQHALE